MEVGRLQGGGRVGEVMEMKSERNLSQWKFLSEFIYFTSFNFHCCSCECATESTGKFFLSLPVTPHASRLTTHPLTPFSLLLTTHPLTHHPSLFSLEAAISAFAKVSQWRAARCSVCVCTLTSDP